jgi:hypothetical protein
MANDGVGKVRPFLPKPSSRAQLAQLVRGVLEDRV